MATDNYLASKSHTSLAGSFAAEIAGLLHERGNQHALHTHYTAADGLQMLPSITECSHGHLASQANQSAL